MKRKLKPLQSVRGAPAVVVGTIIKNLPALLAGQEPMAQILRAKYLALIRAGFNEEQALQICSR